MRTNRADELRRLLQACFSVEELRRFVRFSPDGDRIGPELPGGVVSLAELAAAAVGLLERVRLVTDPAFWTGFVRERGLWAAEIGAVQAMYFGAAATPMPAPQSFDEVLDALIASGVFRVFARLFDGRRVENLLRRAGVDVTGLPTVYTPTPRAWWEHLAEELRQGAVRAPEEVLRKLVLGALEEYPGNTTLLRARGLIGGAAV